MADQPPVALASGRPQPRIGLIKNATNLTLTFTGLTHTLDASRETMEAIDLRPGASLMVGVPSATKAEQDELARNGWTEIVITF